MGRGGVCYANPDGPVPTRRPPSGARPNAQERILPRIPAIAFVLVALAARFIEATTRERPDWAKE